MEIHVKNEFLILFKNKKVAVVLFLSTLTWIFVFFLKKKKKKIDAIRGVNEPSLSKLPLSELGSFKFYSNSRTSKKSSSSS
jgi:hypothetical protein